MTQPDDALEVTAGGVFPRLPKPPVEVGELVTWFEGDVVKAKFDRGGHLVLEVRPIVAHKYQASVLTDIRGKQFTFQVSSKGDAVVRDGELGVYDLRARMAKKKADRLWEQVKRDHFLG